MVRTWLERANFAAIGVLSAVWAAHLLLDDSSVARVLLHASTPFWGAGALVVLCASVALRDRLALAPAGLLALLLARALSPPSVTRSADLGRGDTGVKFVVASVNLFEHNDAPGDMLDELAALDADALALIELDRVWMARIAADLRFDRWSWRVVEDRPDAFGIGLLSRVPVLTSTVTQLFGVPRIDAVLDVEGQEVPLSVVHVTPPYLPRWLPAWLGGLHALAGPDLRAQIVAGDLNATVFNPAFDVLRQGGWVDASEAMGTRLTLTWPNAPLPLLGLDHVLVRPGIGVEQVERLAGRGSDHRGLLVTLRLPTE